jgi:hypothetical protein
VLLALRAATAKAGACSAANVLAAFPRVCVLIDEIVSEGVVEATDKDTLAAGVRMKVPAASSA